MPLAHIAGDNTTRKGQKYIPVDRRARKAKALLATDRILKQLQLPDGTFVTEPKPGLKSLRSRLESFLAAGNHGGLSAEERADRVLEVLQLLLQLGCTLPAIARQAKPPFLRKPVSILEERLDWFVDIAGFSRSEAAAVVLREAYVLRIPMSTLKSAHAFLTDAGLSAEQFSRMLRRQGCQILAMSEPLLAQKLAVFDGAPACSLHRVCTLAPALIFLFILADAPQRRHVTVTVKSLTDCAEYALWPMQTWDTAERIR